MMKQIVVPVVCKKETSFIRLIAGAEPALMVILFGASLIVALQMMGAGNGAVAHLLLPLALAISVWAGLRFRLVGVICVTTLLLCVVGYFLFTGSGYFASGSSREHWILSVGLILIISITSFVTAIVTGFHRRTGGIALRSRNMMHKIFDALPIGIWVRASSGETILVNERWAGFSESSAAEIMASGSTEAPVPLGEEWEAARQLLFNSDDGAVRYQSIELLDASGRPCSMTLLTLKVYIDQVEDFGTLSLLVDETSLRLYEEQIRTSERRLRMALENVEMGFWGQNLETNEIVRGANWCRILNVDTAEEADSLTVWSSRVHPDDYERVLTSYSDFLKSGQDVVVYEYRIRPQGGQYIWVQDRVRIIERSATGQPKQLMGTMQNITDHKRIEIDLLHAKNRAEAGNTAKGHFIATISHEIRTPLNAIIGLSSFLAERGLDEEQLDLAQTIYTSGKSLMLLVNDILDFSKIEAGHLDLEMQEFPLRLCFEDCVKLFKVRADEKQVDLRLSIGSEIPEFAWGDLERLRQIVQNLLANALKFTEAGFVQVSVRQVEVAELLNDRCPDPFEPIGYLDQLDHDYLEVCVSDSGIGIPEDRQDVLFDAFTQADSSMTRKYGGTGLGLAICQRLVNAMGGRIWLESQEGEGSVFGFVVRIKLTVEAAEMEKTTGSPFDSQIRISEEYPCDILIVGGGDETSGLMVSCRKLGYMPHHAPSYDLSSDAFQRRHYNLVFICMSDEASGLALARKLCVATGSKHPNAMVGIVPADQSVSKECCKLAGIQRLIDENPSSALISEVILEMLYAHG
jgi:PAS domain S-box-containing protein